MSFITSLVLLGFAASPAMAFWRLPCKSPLVVERADPIVNPGAVSGHAHTIMGGNGFDMIMDYNSTQASTCTSCTVHGDFSNYWTPTLWFRHQDGSFESVNQVGGATVYYLQRKGDDSETLEAFPEGFRMVAGDPFKRSAGTDFASLAISYNCLDYNKSPGYPETGGFPNYNCPDGLRSQVFFPSCWDGKNLDSADHKSHMAYPIENYNSGHCPSSHPVHLVSIFYEIIWDTNKFAGMWSGNEQPFVWSMGDTTGYGFHGDFVMGWDQDLLQRAINTCTNNSGRVEDCGEFQLYPDATAEQCTKQSRINEAVSGVLSALPGCNPVTNGPEEATPVKDCSGGSIVPGTASSSGASPTSSVVATSISTATSATSTIKTSPALSLTTTALSYTDGMFYGPSSSTTTIPSTAVSEAPSEDTTSQATPIPSSPLETAPNSGAEFGAGSDAAVCAVGPSTITITQVQTSTVYVTPTATSSSSDVVGDDSETWGMWGGVTGSGIVSAYPTGYRGSSWKMRRHGPGHGHLRKRSPAVDEAAYH